MAELRQNTWSLDEWYGQAVAGTTGGYQIQKSLWAWGYDNYGAGGYNLHPETSSPVQVGTDTDWDATGKWKMPYSDCETIGVIKNL